MKTILQKLIFLLLLIFNITNAYSQCSGCQYTITVPNSATHSLVAGQVVCITGTGSFTGQLNNFNGNTLCIGTGVTYNPSTAPNYNGNWTIINNGIFSNTNNLNFNTGVNFTNAATGTIALSNITIGTGVSFVNNGTLTTSGLTVNTSANVTLGGTTTISGNIQNNGNIVVSGSVVATQITNNTAGTIIGGSGANCNSIKATGGFTNNGIYGTTGTGLFVGNTGGTINSPATTALPAAPTSQASALSLSMSGSTITGSFTQTSSVSGGYLILRAFTAGLPPTITNPTNMVTQVLGQTVGLWTVVAINNGQTTTTFTDNVGVTCNNVHYRIYSFNIAGTSSCRVFNTTSPLISTFSTVPTITANTPGNRCGTGTVTLGATSSFGTINWYAALTGGSSLGTGTSFTTPSLSTSTNYYVDATNNGCTTATRTLIAATINTIPTITANTPATRCGTGTVALAATASAGTINWYAAATGGSSLGTGTSFTTPSLSTSTTYYVDATNSGCTTTTRTAILATVNLIPTMTGTTNGISNGTGTVTLGATASIGTLNWYSALTGGSSLGTGNSFVTPSLSTTTTYYVEAVNAGCTLTPRTAVTATINQPEIDIQGNSNSIADGSTLTSLTNWTNFGTTDFNTGAIQRTFTIYNTATSGTLTIGTPVISGANAADFSITTLPSAAVAPSSSTVFVVTYNPSAFVSSVATITISNNDSNENPYNFDVSGTGINDIDGDGIDIGSDIDNDNDGIIDSVECAACVSDPFVNGSFETTTPLLTGASFNFYNVSNVLGWQATENIIEIWSSGFNGVTSSDGNQFAELNANIAGTLYQTFCLNGASGTITWSLKHRGRVGVDQAFVKFGATLAAAQASTPVVTMLDGTSAWGSYSGTYIIPIGQTQIILAFQAGTTATGDLSVGNFIDDVRISINQNCMDTDSDGIANVDDLDSDNDGIADIEEGGFKNYSSNTSTMDKSNPALWMDSNSNGMNDYIDISLPSYGVPDTDLDGIPNYLDLDSDNDAMFDVDESSLLNGDGDVTGDGKGDGLDTDKDGILDLYDNTTTFGTTTRPYAQDTDANGIPDFLQLDSNSDGIKDIATGLYSSLDANNDGKIDGATDSDKDGITDTFDTNTTTYGSPRNLDRKLLLDFDGRNDYAQNTALLGGLSTVSLMAWIDLGAGYTNTGTIVGQSNFQIRINSSKQLEVVVNGAITLCTTTLSVSRWYHVAATYDGVTIKLFLNGTLLIKNPLTGAINADSSLLTLGKNPNPLATDYFKGKIDEVRVFNIALTDVQVQRMVYQEIQNNASQVRGAIVPYDIGSVPFANLVRYYRMDTYKDDIVDDLTTLTLDSGTGMKLFNHKNIYVQQAPMPFVTLRSGDFATAVNDATKDIRGLDVIDENSSILQVKHNITETSNNTEMAMFVDPGITINMTNDTKIQNDWYLLLNGKIDLQGKSQLVQTTNSILDVSSAGSIERDQQGTKNIYNYNYWSSPVGSVNTTSNNTAFSVDGVMKDGTTSTPQNILWTTSLNGSPSPLTLSSYWIFKFQNLSNAYANWASVGPYGSLSAAQGFTLKGSGTTLAKQNFTFVGKPNNGAITTSIAPGNFNLSGNPYPSALDAYTFIDTNNSISGNGSITGTLYFWEHSSTNNTHNLSGYQGGYSALTKTGGTPPVAPAAINGLGLSTKVPGRYIPVAQGFFLIGSATGGTIQFNNSQRGFFKEDNASSNTLFRNNLAPSIVANNADDVTPVETFKKVRLGMTSSDNYHRQILLGFMDNNATDGIDYGYDAINIDNQVNDMYFVNSGATLNIQGVGAFDTNNVYPIGIKNNVAGDVKIMVDKTENFNTDQRIFIFDKTTGIYHQIGNEPFTISLPQGVTDNRFQLTFRTNTQVLANEDFNLSDGIVVAYASANSTLGIKNNLIDTIVEKVTLFNILGQTITTFDTKDQNQQNIQLPITGLNSGTYIVKVKTDKGDTTKKIVFN